MVSQSSASSNLIGQPTEKEVSDRTYNKASGGSFQNKAKNIKYFKKESNIKKRDNEKNYGIKINYMNKFYV